MSEPWRNPGEAKRSWLCGFWFTARRTHELPQLGQYLNHFGKHHLAGTGSCWTICAVSVNQPAQVHMDAHHAVGSSNFTCSLGQYSGGELWVELGEDCPASSAPVRWKTKHNGQRVPGHVHPTRHRFAQFSPKAFHATDRWTGFRISLTYYASRLINQASKACRNRLCHCASLDPLFPSHRLLQSAWRLRPSAQLRRLQPMMTAPFLTQDVRKLLHESCQEVWDEVNSLLDVHGRDPNVVQVVEFGGPSESPLCSLLQKQGGSSFVANLTEGYDLDSRGGCHQSRQQTENLQPNFAWFQLPEGPPRRDSCPEDSKHRALVLKSRKVIRHAIALSQLQLQHGECVWISDKHSSPWREPEACQFWQYLA